MTRSHMDVTLIGKSYRLEGVITAARLAEDNDNWKELKNAGTGLAQLLEVMAELAAELTEGIERMQNEKDRNVSIPIIGTAG